MNENRSSSFKPHHFTAYAIAVVWSQIKIDADFFVLSTWELSWFLQVLFISECPELTTIRVERSEISDW